MDTFYAAPLVAVAAACFSTAVPDASALTVSAPAAPQDAAPASKGLRALTFEEVAGKPGVDQIRFSASMPSWRWSSAGENVLSRREGRRGEAKLFDAASGDPIDSPTVKRAAKKGGAADELAQTIEGEIAAATGSEYTAKKTARIAKALASGFEQQSTDGKTRLVYVDEELWVRREGHTPIVIARGAEGEIRYDRLSSNGLWVTYARDNDLYIADTGTGRVRALTSNGGPDQFNGVLDWVYQEEIYGRGDFQAHFWSPAGTHTAFISLDESPVHEFTVVDHIEKGHFRVKAEVTNYPKVGDPNPIPEVGIVNAEQGATAWVDLSRYDG